MIQKILLLGKIYSIKIKNEDMFSEMILDKDF